MTYSNIFYFSKISKIGGTEQFLYEIAKKYHKYDITIFYDEADIKQIKRLRKYVRCLKHIKGNLVKCKKAFLNFNIDMIDDIEAEEYIFVSHAIYQELGYKPPIEHPKLTKFIGVSQYASDKIEEYGRKLGMEIEATKCYNPLTLEEPKKVPIIVSAARLDDNTKGGKRTIELIKALDRYCVENDRQYLWLIFTNKTSHKINSPNAVYMKPRIDVRPYIAMADFIGVLSNDMETFGYTNEEGLGYGVPLISTPLTILDELGVTDDMKIVLDWDCSNVDEVARLIFERKMKPFKYELPKDNWESILVKEKSSYEEEKNMKVKVRCRCRYVDVELSKEAGYEVYINPDPTDENYERVISRKRADEILENTASVGGAIEIIETIREPKKEDAKLDTKVEKAVRKNKKKSK